MRGTQHAIALAAGVVLGLAGQALMTRLRILYMSKMRRRRLPYFLSDRCAEAQRLRSGGRFEARHPDVWPMLRYAKEMCDEFNSQPLGARPREVILRDLFGSIPTVGPPPNVEAPIYVDYGCHITVGKDFYANNGCILLDGCEIKIGDYVKLAPNVQIYTAEHPLDHVERRAVESGRPVTIGDDVWIGGGAIILPGVTIGNRAVVAAGAVVTKDVQADTIVAGCPARVIRDLHSDPPVVVSTPRR